ncbi:Polysaccharide biosynthesis protein [uncultured archaeon]|nr:Polysaccharide biosynthesis protein [uncultured archaeon]
MLDYLKKYYRDPLYRNSIAMMLNSVFAALFGLLFWIVAARTMSSKDIGLATAAISAAGVIVAFSRLGLDQGLVRYLPELKEKRGFYSTIVILTLALSLIIAGIFLIGINIFSPALSFIREGWFLPVFLAYIVITSIFSMQNMALIAIRRADLALIQNLLLGARILLLIFLTSLGVFGIFSAFGAAFLLTSIFGTLILQKNGLSITGSFDIASIRKTLKFSMGNYLAGIFLMAPLTIIPIMIVNTIGAEEGAYFYVAYSVAALLFMIPNAVSTSLFVEGSHSLPLKENVLKSIKMILMLLVPALIFIFLFGNKLLLLFSREYSVQAYEMLQLLSISSIFSAVISIFISIKKIQQEVRIINYLNFALSVLIIGFGYIALFKYGLVGLGYAWLGANAVVCAMIIGVMGKSFTIKK